MLSQDGQSYSNKVDLISKIVSNFKQLYMMAKDKKAPISLLAELVSKGFKYGFNGYWLALVKKDIENMNTFKLECEKLAKAGEQIAKIVECLYKKVVPEGHVKKIGEKLVRPQSRAKKLR